MAYVIAEPCIGTKDSACVDACPVDCIHPKKDEAGYAEADQLFIDPVECIDCGACVPVCPVSAIFALDDLPEKQRLAVLLCRQDELSYEEIADVLELSLSATKSLIHRARETLKLRLKPYLQTGAWEEEGFKILEKYGVEYADRSVSLHEAARRAVVKIQGPPTSAGTVA